MRLEAKKYLLDIDAAAGLIATFTAGRSFPAYAADPLLRSAVERQFEIIGEALRGLTELEPELAGSIPEHRRIIAFRNVLIHGYANVDHRLVWGVVEGDSSPSLRPGPASARRAGVWEPRSTDRSGAFARSAG